MSIDPVTRLIAIEEIKQLKARYFRCMDTKDYTGLRAVFADDAVFDATGVRLRSLPFTPEKVKAAMAARQA